MASRRACAVAASHAMPDFDRFGIRMPPRYFEDSSATELVNHFVWYAPLTSTHIFVRHGESEANILGIAAEGLDTDINRCGLTEVGRKQVQAGLGEVIKSCEKCSEVIVTSSPLLRARESALIGLKGLISAGFTAHSEIVICDGLSERFYGEMNGLPYHTFREAVMMHDLRSPFRGLAQSESAIEFCDRVTRTVTSLDRDLGGQTDKPVTFVHFAHLMVIKAIRTCIARHPPGQFHSAQNIENGRCFVIPPGERSMAL